MNLNELSGSKSKPRHRVGRGPGSGSGKTSGRGHKGYGQRSGSSSRRGFEGGQMPLQRRVPKRGFHNVFKARVAEVGLRDLERVQVDGPITPDVLREHGVIKGRFDLVKVLATGELTRAVVVQAHAFSEGARKKIEAAGGTATVIARE